MTDYHPHPLLGMTPEEVLGALLAKIREVNPDLSIGESVGPGDSVWQGKLVPEYLPHDMIVRLDYAVKPVDRPRVPLGSSKSVKIFFEDPHGFDSFKGLTGYLHPVSVSIPHREWLSSHKPGDVVNLNDTNYSASPHALTKDDFNRHSYVTFRYILSDQ